MSCGGESMRKSKTFNRAVKEDAKKIDLLLKRNNA
jgi:hypothetical protein